MCGVCVKCLRLGKGGCVAVYVLTSKDIEKVPLLLHALFGTELGLLFTSVYWTYAPVSSSEEHAKDTPFLIKEQRKQKENI